jgi:hypothetical protein
LVPPYTTGDGQHFWTPCPSGGCGKITKYFFINGGIVSRKPVVKFSHFTQLRAQGGVKAEIADVAAEGCETSYLDSNRGAAVVFRVAAELFALSETLDTAPPSQHLPRLQKAIRDIEAQRRFRKLNKGKRAVVLDCLRYLKDLGDSASHPRIHPPSRKKAWTPSNIDTGRSKLEDAVAAAFGL